MTTTIKTGRRPADQAGTGQQDIWLAIKRAEGSFTVSAIANATGVDRAPVMRYLKGLTAAGYLEADAVPAGQPGTWRLVKDIGQHAPRVRADGSKVTQGEITAQLWRAMYMLKDFTYLDLVQNCPAGMSEATAKDYCKRLLAAGYLRVLRKANPAAGHIARYRLVRHSGPKAPQVQRVRRVFDPNNGAVYMLEGEA